MGIISSSPSHGAPVNPRLTYAQKRTKKEKKSILIDAPSLIKLPHGTLRYRYIEDGQDVDKKRIELPHEGSTADDKHGYFYHSHLNDFSPNATTEKEASWKFRYVYQGAPGSKQRKVFYVCGQGVPQGVRVPSQEQQFAAGHVYYDLRNLEEDEQYPEIADSTEQHNGEEETKEPPKIIRIKAVSTESIAEVRRKIALRLLIPAPLLHISFHGRPLSCESLLSDLLPKAGWVMLDLTLELKGTTV